MVGNLRAYSGTMTDEADPLDALQLMVACCAGRTPAVPSLVEIGASVTEAEPLERVVKERMSPVVVP